MSLIVYFPFRELLYQVGCFGKGLCDGEASFGQTEPLSYLLISSGTILEGNRITEAWVWVLFLRSMLVMFFHFWCFLLVMAFAHWTGFCTNVKLTRKLDYIRERPDEDVVSIFSTFK